MHNRRVASLLIPDQFIPQSILTRSVYPDQFINVGFGLCVTFDGSTPNRRASSV